MELALAYPERIANLVVVDISPVCLSLCVNIYIYIDTCECIYIFTYI